MCGWTRQAISALIREPRAPASFLLRRPAHVVSQRKEEKARAVAGRVDDGPGSLARDVLVLARAAQERDVATLGAFVGHVELVAVAVRMDTGPGEGVALGPGLRLFEAADREVVEQLRAVAGLHDAGAFGGRVRADRPHVDDGKRAAHRIGGELRRAGLRERLIGEGGG